MLKLGFNNKAIRPKFIKYFGLLHEKNKELVKWLSV